VALAATVLALAQAAHAQSQPQTPAATALHTRALAATCANCHGTEGRAAPGEPLVALAGLPREHIATQMRAFRDGTRPATVMHQLAKGYSLEQIDQIAAYFAAQK
jgi:cytochrome c553